MAQSIFQSGRLFYQSDLRGGGGYYFHTREHVTMGPYPSRIAGELAIINFIISNMKEKHSPQAA